MKTKLLLLTLLFACFIDFAHSQTTLTLGTDTSSSATRGPFQRSDSGSSSVYSRASILYTATELASLAPSATISQINFDLGSTNIITASGDATMTIYMRNSSATEVVANGSTWTDAINGATIVGTYTFNTTNNFPGAEGFMNFVLSTDFNYTGGALEIAVDWDSSGLVPLDPMTPNVLFSGNGSLNWHWSNTTHQSLNYRAGSSSAPSTLTSRKAQRVNTQIVYNGATTGPTTGQVIGEFPIMDGGMESQTAGNMSSAGSGQAGMAQTEWTVSSTGNSEVRDMTNDAMLARTGDFSAAWAVTPGANNVRMQSPSPTNPTIQTGTAYTVQYFYSAPIDPGNDLDAGIYLNNTSGGVAGNTTDATPFVADTYTKTYREITTGATFNASNWAVARLDGDDNNYTATVRIDDFVVYSGTYDNTAPSDPTAGTYADNSGVAAIGWTAPSGGVDNGGYVVVKYTTAPNADNDPNQNGIYEYGNTITNGTGGLSGTVIYIGTDTSFTDTYVSGNYYKIYAVDKAFNYSNEIVISDATLSLDDTIVSDFKLYPNPSKGILNIQTNTIDSVSVSIYDILGKEVLTADRINNTIDISNLKNGMYIVKMTMNDISITKKIIKE
ncbi:T9SS type A sorting domain-containing protein [Kordia sp. YSTF-M3]|uniref:T9SS type A sorting domain-containing protein n=1 Tax=Kordia aestuariivivens TaxID=2759037 RepID=A0ABR7Q4F8_9FLAO|nr:T9SS type A sorting domain-containing protein [Kordia aestuariivivens]MBC8753393.1 T9SS type A sorting domain-containing protein [Kordia aestuariivivens]